MRHVPENLRKLRPHEVIHGTKVKVTYQGRWFDCEIKLRDPLITKSVYEGELVLHVAVTYKNHLPFHMVPISELYTEK